MLAPPLHIFLTCPCGAVYRVFTLGAVDPGSTLSAYIEDLKRGSCRFLSSVFKQKCTEWLTRVSMMDQVCGLIAFGKASLQIRG